MVLLGLVAGDFSNWPLVLSALTVVVLVWPLHIPLLRGVEIYLAVQWVGGAAAYLMGVAVLPVFWLASIPGFLLISLLDRFGLVRAHGLAAENVRRFRGQPYHPGALVEGHLRMFLHMSSHLLRVLVLAVVRGLAPGASLFLGVALAEMAVVGWTWIVPIPGRLAPRRTRLRVATALGRDMLVAVQLLDVVMVCFLLLSFTQGGVPAFIVASLATLIVHAMLGRLNETRLESERRRKELVDMRDALARRERLATIGETASRVFHQIARHHGAIGLYARLLQRATDAGPLRQADRERGASAVSTNGLDATVREHADRIMASVEEAKKVIDELLRFGQDRTLNLYPHSLDEVVRETVAQCLPRATSRSVTLDVAPMRETTLTMDKHKVKQALGNILDNAIDASDAGATVGVSAEVDATTVSIIVRDCGTGVPEEMRAHLFTPFSTSKPEGIGLGLTLARELVEAHGGNLDWHAADPGTAFAIALPRTPTASS